MAHFAQIDENNIVINVIVVSDSDCAGGNFPESESHGEAYLKSMFGSNTRWKQTSYNSNFRYNFASIGYKYDDVSDAFIEEKPYESWILDDNFRWKAPLDLPNDSGHYIWNENEQTWVNLEVI